MNDVTRAVAFVATSYFQRFPFQPSRSERKKTDPPIHIGCVSVPGQSVILSIAFEPRS